MELTWSMQLLYASGGAVVLMLLLWLAQLATGKVALVDVGWAVLVGGSFVFFALTGSGDETRRWVGGVMGALWSFHLGTHMLFNRVLTSHEDGRYKEWRQHYKEKFKWVMLAFFMAQAVTIPLLAGPHLYNAHAAEAPLAMPILAGTVWTIGWVGVIVSDVQLERFKRNPANKGKVCDVGLWRYSRHPNYFFSWVMWVGYGVLAALPVVSWWSLPVAWSGAAIMLFLLLKVSGIPPAEKQAVKSRGDAYRRYQRTTSAFVPLPPKNDKEAA